MFLGTHTPKLDEKGRFFLPAKFRDELDDGLVITRGQDRCLAIYPTETFVEMTREIAKGSVSVKKVRDYQRMLAAGASDTAPDKQGRVMIPPMLRRYAALNKEIVVVGAITRVEVWDATEWEKYSEAQEEAFAAMTAAVFADEALLLASGLRRPPPARRRGRSRPRPRPSGGRSSACHRRR